MLCSHISAAEAHDYRNDRFRCAYKWLSETDLGSLPPGRYPLPGDGVFAVVQEYETRPREEKRFETHADYYDIQYVVSGREMIGVCRRDQIPAGEQVEGQDLWFHPEPALFGEVLLTEGDLLVVAPEDAHKPGCIAGEAMRVKKVVVKVRV